MKDIRNLSMALAAALALAAAAPAPLRADVFMRVGAGTPAQTLSGLGGAVMRSGAIRVNGQPGTLSAFGFEKSLREIAGELARKLGRPDIARDAGPRTPTLLFPWRPDDPSAGAVFLFSDPDVDNTLALAIQLDPGADAKAARPEWPWRDVAQPGGFAPGFSATVSDGRTGLVTGTSPLSPDAMRRAMRERLSAAGWTPVTPAADVTSAVLYARAPSGRKAAAGAVEIFLVSVTPPAAGRDSGAGSDVLLLRRRPDPPKED